MRRVGDDLQLDVGVHELHRFLIHLDHWLVRAAHDE